MISGARNLYNGVQYHTEQSEVQREMLGQASDGVVSEFTIRCFKAIDATLGIPLSQRPFCTEWLLTKICNCDLCT